jgi:hypothetical protein
MADEDAAAIAVKSSRHAKTAEQAVQQVEIALGSLPPEELRSEDFAGSIILHAEKSEARAVSATGYQVYDPLTTHVCTAADNCVKGQTYARNSFPGANNPACWQARPQWSRRVMSDRVGWIRTHYVPQLSMAVQKDFHLTEPFKLRFRTEAFNLTNTPIFPGPSTDIFTPPHELSNGSWIGLGTVRYDQQNFPRNIQFSLKLLF